VIPKLAGRQYYVFKFPPFLLGKSASSRQHTLPSLPKLVWRSSADTITNCDRRLLAIRQLVTILVSEKSTTLWSGACTTARGEVGGRSNPATWYGPIWSLIFHFDRSFLCLLACNSCLHHVRCNACLHGNRYYLSFFSCGPRIYQLYRRIRPINSVLLTVTRGLVGIQVPEGRSHWGIKLK